MIKNKIILYFFVTGFFLTPLILGLSGFGLNSASALEVSLPGLPSSPTVIEYAAYFFNLAMAIGASLALVSIAIGGTYYLTSFSKGNYMSQGKEWVRAGILGLILLLSAYLIAYTINPDLLSFKLPGLPPIRFLGITIGGDTSDSLEKIFYQEIPIGTLTETLMTKTMFCYDFDYEGNPIPEKLKTDNDGDVGGPTYRNHDRVDCLLKLMDAAQKKAKIISDLSKEIKKLMETCRCDDTKCESKTKDFCLLSGGGYSCTPGDHGTKDSCVAKAGTSGECCDAATRNKIEHGLIDVTTGGHSQDGQCDGTVKKYHGLDEFRTEMASVANYIEKTVQVDEKDIKIINIDGGQGVKTQKRWTDLKLIEQLMYFKEKIEEIEGDIKSDEDKLDSARNAVANCYNVKSSVDFLQLKQSIKPEEKKIILPSPWDNNVDSSKYCAGFNYVNSSCYSSCNNMCPDTTKEVAQCYSDAIKDKCDINDSNYQGCLNNQQKRIEDCYNNRTCIFQDPSVNKPAGTYKQCISICRQDCTTLCSKRYLPCSDDYNFCESQCGENSKCVLDNADVCLFNTNITNSPDFKNCLDQDDSGNKNFCLSSSYLCKYGSDEFAGYPECTNGYTGCAPNTQQLGNNYFSSPYIFDNWDQQRCPTPYEGCLKGANAGKSCLELYPEASKCPSNSSCSDCPCGEINAELKFSVDDLPLDNVDNPKCPPGQYYLSTLRKCLPIEFKALNSIPSASNPTTSGPTTTLPGTGNPTTNEPKESKTISVNISDRTLVVGECNEYLYSTDPLTFYCPMVFKPENSLNKDAVDVSKATANEVPVGETVDNSKKWAEDLLATADSYLESINKILGIAKKIKEKKPDEYCRCDSKYDSVSIMDKGKPVCTSNCQYNPPDLIDFDGDGNPIYSEPSCSKFPCDGNSCQQMIDYLTMITDNYIQLRTDFINIYVYILKEPRTDPLKQLSYSRKKMDSCSRGMVSLGPDDIKTVSCTRAYPSTGFLSKRCYGILDGLVQSPAENRTDNWFCFQKVK
jgi:hypothetical protein